MSKTTKNDETKEEDQGYSVNFVSEAEAYSFDWFIDAYEALAECASSYDVSVIAGLHENDRLHQSDHFYESRNTSITLALGVAERLRSTYEGIILEVGY